MVYRQVIGATSYVFADLRELLAKATPPRSGDRLAGVAAESAEANDRGADGARRRAAQAIPQRGGDPLRGRRGHPADPRYPCGAGLCADFRADRRRLPRLAVVRCRNQRNARQGFARDHAGNGRRRFEADAQPGSDPGRQEMRGDVGVSQHHRPEGADERAAAAQPSLRRRQGHYRLDPRRHPAWDRAMPASASIRPATIRP